MSIRGGDGSDFPHNKYARVGFEKPAWYHCDHLGTPLEMTDDTGAIVWQASYSAFGITTIREGRQGLNTFGHSGKASGKPLNDQYQNNLRFQGQQYDEETGLHYNRHRYYDPSQGRYLSLDPIGLAGGVNLYGYVEGNPIGDIDPLGLSGTQPKNAGKGIIPGAIPNAIQNAREQSDKTADLPVGLQGLLCAFGVGCIPKEAFVCLRAKCIRADCGQDSEINYYSTESKAIPTESLFPPPPDEMPEGWKCTQSAPRLNGPRLNPPGL